MVTNYDGESIEFKETLPLLPVRDIVIYPFMIIPLFVGRESSIKAVEEAINNRHAEKYHTADKQNFLR